MTTIELLSELQSLDVRLWAEGDRLRYSAPEGVMTRAMLDELVKCKAEVLTLIKCARDSESVSTDRISQVSREQHLPLSFAQQRLWFLNQLEPSSSFYNVPSAVRLEGPLNAGSIEQSLGQVLRRHEVLRTTFPSIEGRPIQFIHPAEPLNVPVTNLSGLSEDEKQRQMSLLAALETQRPFNLAEGPLVRARLLKLSPEQHVAIFTKHHIVSDGWSTGILVREISSLYDALSKGLPSSLPELPIQYADYAVWQRGWLSGERLEEQLGYWRSQLSGIEPLHLPTDRARPAQQSKLGKSKRFVLNRELSRGLKRVSREESATLFMTMLASFQGIMSRYSGQREISVGTPVAGRKKVEVENLIGFFVNTLVIKNEVEGRASHRERIRAVRQTMLEADRHQDVPFEKLVEELQPERDMSREPLFQVMFMLQNAPVSEMRLGSLNMTTVMLETNSAKFDLTVAMFEEASELAGLFEYNCDLFDESTIARMIEHFKRMLEATAGSPDELVGETDILSEPERALILSEWNDTKVEHPANRCIHEMIEATAAASPDAIALIYQEQNVSYCEMNGRANRLARYLSSQGVGPDMLVGICAERSVEMVVGLLGILKAGGAYVPVDPTYPRERLEYMFSDANFSVLLTQSSLLAQLPAYHGRVFALDEDWAQIEVHGDENLSVDLHSENLAYAIYTSGSTGKPKGAMNTHRGIVNRLSWMHRQYNLQPGEAVLQKTPFSFDVSVWEFFWPLMVGGRLVMARPEGHRDSEYLVRLIEEKRISTVHFVPSMLEMFLNERGIEGCLSLQRVICSGEALGAELKRKFYRRSKAGLHNLYGPTEAAVDVTSWECGDEESMPSVPIGKPISNTRIYVLDEQMNPAPIGAAGELYIGGAGVARGYLNRADMTAERFVPSPFEDAGTDRLYRTGDQVRWRADGVLEFLGRKDQQVKIRGFRIELGEIEAALQAHPKVAHAVVMLRERGDGEKRLVAYAVVKKDEATTGSHLRSHLKERLPEHMVPAIVLLDRIPLTPNGKIDRRALPQPETNAEKREYQAPRNHVEEVIAEIWARVLGVERVGIEDDFFEMGGHSLLISQIAFHLRETLRVDIPLRSLYGLPTVAQVAELIAANEASARQAEKVASALGRIRSMSPEQQRILLENKRRGVRQAQ